MDFKYVNVVCEAEEDEPPQTGYHPVVDSTTGLAGAIIGPGPHEYSIAISEGTPPYTIEWRGWNVIYSGADDKVSILRCVTVVMATGSSSRSRTLLVERPSGSTRTALPNSNSPMVFSTMA